MSIESIWKDEPDSGRSRNAKSQGVVGRLDASRKIARSNVAMTRVDARNNAKITQKYATISEMREPQEEVAKPGFSANST